MDRGGGETHFSRRKELHCRNAPDHGAHDVGGGRARPSSSSPPSKEVRTPWRSTSSARACGGVHPNISRSLHQPGTKVPLATAAAELASSTHLFASHSAATRTLRYTGMSTVVSSTTIHTTTPAAHPPTTTTTTAAADFTAPAAIRSRTLCSRSRGPKATRPWQTWRSWGQRRAPAGAPRRRWTRFSSSFRTLMWWRSSTP